MKIIGILLALWTFPAFAETLTFQNGTILADSQWQQGPQVSKESILLISWRDSAGQPLTPSFRVILWMPDMGHGSAPTKIFPLNTPGAFQVKKMFFTMPGEWEVKVELALPNGTLEIQQFLLNL